MFDFISNEVVSTYFFVKISSGLRVDFFTRRGNDAGIMTDERGKIRRKDGGRLTKKMIVFTIICIFYHLQISINNFYAKLSISAGVYNGF